MRLLVGMTGATGAIFGIRLLEVLQSSGVEVHLVLSRWAERTIEHETGRTVDDVRRLAHVTYKFGDQGAAVSSGSFKMKGMIIAPCSMNTLAAIAHGLADNLVVRSADVMLKEQRKVVLMPRETPLSTIHLENMLKVSRAGALIMPPMPAFYNHPQSLDDIVNHLVGRALDQFDIDAKIVRRWQGMGQA